MAYRIVYPGKGQDIPAPKDGRCLRLTILFLGLFLLLSFFFWPEGREVLRTILIPGDAEVTLQAAEVFAQEMGNGFSLQEAARNFCISVLTHGHPG